MGLFSVDEPDIPAFVGQAEDNALQSANLQAALLDFIRTGVPQNVVRGGVFPRGIQLSDIGFSGNVVPGAGPILQGAFEQANQFEQSPLFQQQQSTLMNLAQGESGFAPDPNLRERFFQQQIVNPATERFERTTIPTILARFGSGGQTGAIRSALSEAGRDLQADLAGQQAGLLRSDEALRANMQNFAQNRALQAAGGLQNLQLGGLRARASLGDASRQIVGQQNQERLQRAILGSPFGDPRLGLLPAASGGATTFGPAIPQQGFGLGGLVQGLGRLF